MHSSLFKIRGQRDNKLIQATTQMDKNENNYQLGLNLFFFTFETFSLVGKFNLRERIWEKELLQHARALIVKYWRCLKDWSFDTHTIHTCCLYDCFDCCRRSNWSRARWEDRQLWKKDEVKRWELFPSSWNTCLAALIKCRSESDNRPPPPTHPHLPLRPCASFSGCQCPHSKQTCSCLLCAWKSEEKIDSKSYTHAYTHTWRRGRKVSVFSQIWHRIVLSPVPLIATCGYTALAEATCENRLRHLNPESQLMGAGRCDGNSSLRRTMTLHNRYDSFFVVNCGVRFCKRAFIFSC